MENPGNALEKDREADPEDVPEVTLEEDLEAIQGTTQGAILEEDLGIVREENLEVGLGAILDKRN